MAASSCDPQPYTRVVQQTNHVWLSVPGRKDGRSSGHGGHKLRTRQQTITVTQAEGTSASAGTWRCRELRSWVGWWRELEMNYLRRYTVSVYMLFPFSVFWLTTYLFRTRIPLPRGSLTPVDALPTWNNSSLIWLIWAPVVLRFLHHTGSGTRLAVTGYKT